MKKNVIISLLLVISIAVSCDTGQKDDSKSLTELLLLLLQADRTPVAPVITIVQSLVLYRVVPHRVVVAGMALAAVAFYLMA